MIICISWLRLDFIDLMVYMLLHGKYFKWCFTMYSFRFNKTKSRLWNGFSQFLMVHIFGDNSVSGYIYQFFFYLSKKWISQNLEEATLMIFPQDGIKVTQ